MFNGYKTDSQLLCYTEFFFFFAGCKMHWCCQYSSIFYRSSAGSRDIAGHLLQCFPTLILNVHYPACSVSLLKCTWFKWMGLHDPFAELRPEELTYLFEWHVLEHDCMENVYGVCALRTRAGKHWSYWLTESKQQLTQNINQIQLQPSEPMAVFCLN